MAYPLFADPDRLVLGTRKVPTSYTYCISRRNFFGGKQLRVLSGSN
jgi:hypothetical protein